MDGVDELREKRRRVIEIKDSFERQASSVYDETDRVSGVKLMKHLVLKGNTMKKAAREKKKMS